MRRYASVMYQSSFEFRICQKLVAYEETVDHGGMASNGPQIAHEISKANPALRMTTSH